jgi:diguanylate cyclase (GGDEF)-like protein
VTRPSPTIPPITDAGVAALPASLPDTINIDRSRSAFIETDKRANSGWIGADMDRAGETSSRGLRLNRAERGMALRFAVLGNAMPIAVATASNFDSHHTIFFVGAVAACIAPIVVTTMSRRHPVPFYAAAFGGIPAMTMMQAYSGGAASGYSVLVMMAMIWFGLQASDRELFIGIGVLAICSYGPMLIFSSAAYPTEWGHATLLVLVGATVAGTLRTLSRETVRLTNRLRREAVVDALTGVLNRRGWEESARAELARAARAHKPVVLATIDLDGLKRVNDTMGHDVGDRLIAETAERMSTALREGDIVARLGGDEFAALLSDASLDHGLETIRRLREVTPPLGGFSAGVVAWKQGEDLHETLRRADVALGAAKVAGGGQVEIGPATLDPLDDPLLGGSQPAPTERPTPRTRP